MSLWTLWFVLSYLSYQWPRHTQTNGITIGSPQAIGTFVSTHLYYGIIHNAVLVMQTCWDTFKQKDLGGDTLMSVHFRWSSEQQSGVALKGDISAPCGSLSCSYFNSFHSTHTTQVLEDVIILGPLNICVMPLWIPYGRTALYTSSPWKVAWLSLSVIYTLFLGPRYGSVLFARLTFL